MKMDPREAMMDGRAVAAVEVRVLPRETGGTWLAGGLARILRRHRDRAAYRRMLALPDHMLRDMGLDRADVIRAIRFPDEARAGRR